MSKAVVIREDGGELAPHHPLPGMPRPTLRRPVLQSPQGKGIGERGAAGKAVGTSVRKAEAAKGRERAARALRVGFRRAAAAFSARHARPPRAQPRPTKAKTPRSEESSNTTVLKWAGGKE